MGTEQSSPAKGHSKEEQKITSSTQVIGERGHSIQKRNPQVSNVNLEVNTFVEIDQFGENMTDTESESVYSTSDENEIEDTEEDAYRAIVLEDARKLKALALAFNHPEIGVNTTSFTAFGRNYFSRPSAIDQEDVDDAEERAQVLADVTALKKLATDYLHPEVGVSSTSPTAFGRNYFSRPSAIDQEDVDDAEERGQVLADVTALKKLAVDYNHPEVGMSSTSPTAFGRNYFSRPSAIGQEDVDDAEERAQVLADATALKKLATDYLHPEVGVSSTSPTAFGRNYFSRPSAIGHEDVDDAEERAQVLADATALKKLAVDYNHPELGVSSTSPTAFGRNYFNMLSFRKPLPVSNAIPRATNKVDQKSIQKMNLSTDVTQKKLSEIDHCNVKRSPSSVILIGLGDDDGSAY